MSRQRIPTLEVFAPLGLAIFHDGAFLNKVDILVDPRDEFNPHNIRIHGIKPEHVVGRPTIEKVFPVTAAQLTNTIATHHSSFDRGALSRAAERYGVADLSFNWIDTVSVAKRAWRELGADGGFGLATSAIRGPPASAKRSYPRSWRFSAL